jgi:hypothetical protein
MPDALTRVLAGAALVLTAGCDSDFEPYNELSSLRVLAIQSAPAAPAPGERSALTPLIYVPEGRTVTSAWSWCPVEFLDDGRCPIEEDAVQSLGGPSFDLGVQATAAFEHRLDPEALERLCSEAPLANPALGALDCSEGFPIQVRYDARTEDDAVESVRRLVLRFAPEHDANENPRVDGVSAIVAEERRVLDGTGQVALPRGTGVELVAAVPETASEQRVDPATGEERRERLVFTWFVEAGETHYERTSFVEGVLPLERATANRWTLPSLAEHAPDTAAMVLVVRDDRGGVGWRESRVRLGAGP